MDFLISRKSLNSPKQWKPVYQFYQHVRNSKTERSDTLFLGMSHYNNTGKIIWELFIHEVCQVLSRGWLFVAAWRVAHQAPLSMEFSRQKYWSGLPFPPPGYLPNPGIKPASLVSPALADGFFTNVPSGKPICEEYLCANNPVLKLNKNFNIVHKINGI